MKLFEGLVELNCSSTVIFADLNSFLRNCYTLWNHSNDSSFLKIKEICFDYKSSGNEKFDALAKNLQQIFLKSLLLHRLDVGLCCRFKANCPLVGPGPIGRVPSVGGSFKWILARIYANFEENHRKLRTASLTSATEVGTWHLESTNFESSTAQPLVGSSVRIIV